MNTIQADDLLLKLERLTLAVEKVAYALTTPKIHFEVDGAPKEYPFHGGCHMCTAYNEHGAGYCEGCMFYYGNWNLPDRSTGR